MAYTERILDGDNTVGPFAVGINYLRGSAVKAYLTDSDGSNPAAIAFTFAGTPTTAQPEGTTILLASPAIVGKKLRIVKEISMDSPVVTWELGAELDLTALHAMNTNLMEMAQTAYDEAQDALTKALAAQADALAATSGLSSIQTQTDAAVAAAQQAVTDAAAWAAIAEAAAGVANPGATAEAARDAAIAARDAALAAQALAEAARDAAIAARDTAQGHATSAGSSASSATASATLADGYANTAKGVEVVTGKYSARHYAETAQDIVDAGALKWNGSAKFVSTSDPDPALGANGDFWFKREA